MQPTDICTGQSPSLEVVWCCGFYTVGRKRNLLFWNLIGGHLLHLINKTRTYHATKLNTQKYCTHGYFLHLFFSPFYTFKLFRPVLKKFAQFKSHPLKLREGHKFNRDEYFPVLWNNWSSFWEVWCSCILCISLTHKSMSPEFFLTLMNCLAL